MAPAWDIALLRAINGHSRKNATLDAVGIFCSRWLIAAMFVFVAVYAFLLSLGGSEGPSRMLFRAGLLGMCAALASFVASAFVSPLWFRPRPFARYPEVRRLIDEPSTPHSFPSSHASAAFALAVSVHAVDPWLGALLLAAATLVGFGRMFAGVHYPTDVIAGALLGTVFSRFALSLNGLI